MLEGDAFFESGRAQIKPEALEKLKELGHNFKLGLQTDEVIVVQGHTDDVQYQNQSKSNWELSGERAAAVCRVFQEPNYGVNISGRQLLALGYGEFRPRAIIDTSDPPDIVKDKRAQNRRIEIRKLKGAEVFARGKL
jgi:chemotaxis protein MotB